MKLCPGCKREKPTTDFYKRSSSKDGLAYYCSECHKIRNDKYRKLNNIKNGIVSRQSKKTTGKRFI